MSVLSFSPNGGSRSCASHDLVRPFTLILFINSPKASSMMCTIHGMLFHKAGHSIPVASSVNCSSWVIVEFFEALSVTIPSKRLSLNWKCWRTSFVYMASPAQVCWPLTNCPQLAFVTGKEDVINLTERKLLFTKCQISIQIVRNEWCYGQFIYWCPPIQS
jgi:hypothetical protein